MSFSAKLSVHQILTVQIFSNKQALTERIGNHSDARLQNGEPVSHRNIQLMFTIIYLNGCSKEVFSLRSASQLTYSYSSSRSTDPRRAVLCFRVPAQSLLFRMCSIMFCIYLPECVLPCSIPTKLYVLHHVLRLLSCL